MKTPRRGSIAHAAQQLAAVIPAIMLLAQEAVAAELTHAQVAKLLKSAMMRLEQNTPEAAREEMLTMIHIVGLDIRIGSRVRQRCAWCDLVIEDVDLSLMMSPAGSPPWRPWNPGELLNVIGGVRQVVKHEDGAPLPDGMCVDADIPKKRPTLRVVGS